VAAGCGHGGKKEVQLFARFKAVPPVGRQVTSEDLSRSVAIMQQRLDELGVDGEVRRQGPDVIVVELPADARLHDPVAAAKLIGKSALLEFYDFEANLTGPSVSGLARAPIAKPSLFALLSDPTTRALANKGMPSQTYVLRGQRLAVPENTVVISCKVETGNCLSTRQITTSEGFYLFRNSPEMTGRDLNLSETRADIDPQSNAPVVLIQFRDRGKRIFHDITRREAQRGALVCGGQHDNDAVLRCAQHFAIVLDHEIQMVPYIDFFRNPDGIPGDNGAQIELGAGGSLGEAKRLALVLQTGALPVQFVRVP
jgi:preprotein translocase subunit SecD